MPFDGANLAAIRSRRKLTQEQLASRAGCSRCSINRWERGRQPPDLDAALRLAAALRVPLARLLAADR